MKILKKTDKILVIENKRNIILNILYYFLMVVFLTIGVLFLVTPDATYKILGIIFLVPLVSLFVLPCKQTIVLNKDMDTFISTKYFLLMKKEKKCRLTEIEKVEVGHGSTFSYPRAFLTRLVLKTGEKIVVDAKPYDLISNDTNLSEQLSKFLGIYLSKNL